MVSLNIVSQAVKGPSVCKGTGYFQIYYTRKNNTPERLTTTIMKTKIRLKMTYTDVTIWGSMLLISASTSEKTVVGASVGLRVGECVGECVG